VDDRPREAVIGDDEVAATTEDEDLLADHVGVPDGVEEREFGCGGDEVPRRAAQAQGGVLGQQCHAS
jgi:hypothetical protein